MLSSMILHSCRVYNMDLDIRGYLQMLLHVCRHACVRMCPQHCTVPYSAVQLSCGRMHGDVCCLNGSYVY